MRKRTRRVLYDLTVAILLVAFAVALGFACARGANDAVANSLARDLRLLVAVAREVWP